MFLISFMDVCLRVLNVGVLKHVRLCKLENLFVYVSAYAERSISKPQQIYMDIRGKMLHTPVKIACTFNRMIGAMEAYGHLP
jgi:hypothetical protein